MSNRTAISAQKPPSPRDPPLRRCHHRCGRDPSSDLLFIPILTRCERGFASLGRPASSWGSNWWRISAIIGAADRTAAVLYPLPDFFSFLKTGMCSASIRPPRPHRRALPPSACGTSPARRSCLYPWSITSSSLDVCGCACCDICGPSADAAARSAAAVARLAQPRINFFGFYENSTKNQGGGTSDLWYKICGRNTVLPIVPRH